VAAAKKAAAALTKMALERGTRDNVTVVVIELCQAAGSSGRRSLR
jgi:serine/threonine protein phosphatase PrpC